MKGGEEMTYRIYVVHHLDPSREWVATARTFEAKSDDDAQRKLQKFIADGGFTCQSFDVRREP